MKTQRRHRSTSILLMSVAMTSVSLQAADLVKDGAARAVIVVAPEVHAYQPPVKARPGPPQTGTIVDTHLAATELIEHIEKMSGARLEMVPAGADLAGRLPIYLDQAASASLDELIRKTSTDGFAFALTVTDKAVSIRGLSSRGTLIGVYELLEQLGVR